MICREAGATPWFYSCQMLKKKLQSGPHKTTSNRENLHLTIVISCTNHYNYFRVFISTISLDTWTLNICIFCITMSLSWALKAWLQFLSHRRQLLSYQCNATIKKKNIRQGLNYYINNSIGGLSKQHMQSKWIWILYLLAKGERDISVLYHVHYLSLHCWDEKHNPIKQQDWPKYRHIKCTKER